MKKVRLHLPRPQDPFRSDLCLDQHLYSDGKDRRSPANLDLFRQLNETEHPATDCSECRVSNSMGQRDLMLLQVAVKDFPHHQQRNVRPNSDHQFAQYLAPIGRLDFGEQVGAASGLLEIGSHHRDSLAAAAAAAAPVKGPGLHSEDFEDGACFAHHLTGCRVS